MGRTPTPADRKDINFSVKLPREDMAYLDGMRSVLKKTAIADVLRDITLALRTHFSLPTYQVDRLRLDMETRQLNFLEYIQELLARRYEELCKDEVMPPPPLPPVSHPVGALPKPGPR